ncbi:MAG: S-methyl-5-thioribose-1-phosphate isomerase [Pycnora praestabilis]|nr:MAG: S-methyl-5-thioribose-1-phosphate isomerase [Pycnora praestabilis]
MVLEAIKYSRGSLEILNQLQLPHETYYDDIDDCRDAWRAIKDMRVRGAPAIAIVAALALAVELTTLQQKKKLPSVAEEVKTFVEEKLDYLQKSRPTAVNLADAANKLKKAVETAAATANATGDSIRQAYVEAAEQMLVDDVRDNENIGKHGAEWILKNAKRSEPDGKVSVLTHCNTGSLATAGYGTALGIVRALHSTSHLHIAYYTETRPYNQGSRLTAYEMKHDKIPACLVTDSMAGALLDKKRRSMNIVAIIVGADRVATNGDTANKIGTYTLAILARHHGVKFLVAAPRTTIDLSIKSGEHIIIEERPKEEVTNVTGPRSTGGIIDQDHVETVSLAPSKIRVWNPAFDVTPAQLIDGIITERGVVEKGSDGSFCFDKIFQDVAMPLNGIEGHIAVEADSSINGHDNAVANDTAEDGIVMEGLVDLTQDMHESKRKREDSFPQ